MRINALWLILFAFIFDQFSLAAPILDVSGKSLLSGKSVRFLVNEKKGLVVVFLSAKCPCSNSHVSELNALADSFPEFKFVAIHSNSNEDETSAKTYFESRKLSFTVIEDSKAGLADRFKALKTPLENCIRRSHAIA